MQFIFVHVWVPGGDRNSNFWMTKLYSIIKYCIIKLNIKVHYWTIALLNYSFFTFFHAGPNKRADQTHSWGQPRRFFFCILRCIVNMVMMVQVHVQRYSRGLPSKRMTTSFYLVSTSKTFGDELLLNNNLFRMPTPPKCFSVGSCKDYVQYDTIRYDIIHYN